MASNISRRIAALAAILDSDRDLPPPEPLDISRSICLLAALRGPDWLVDWPDLHPVYVAVVGADAVYS